MVRQRWRVRSTILNAMQGVVRAVWVGSSTLILGARGSSAGRLLRKSISMRPPFPKWQRFVHIHCIDPRQRHWAGGGDGGCRRPQVQPIDSHHSS